MSWTSQPPTVPGWYWLRTRHGVKIVEVMQEDDALVAYYTGYESGASIPGTGPARHAYEIATPSEWAGPLAPP